MSFPIVENSFNQKPDDNNVNSFNYPFNQNSFNFNQPSQENGAPTNQNLSFGTNFGGGSDVHQQGGPSSAMLENNVPNSAQPLVQIPDLQPQFQQPQFQQQPQQQQFQQTPQFQVPQFQQPANSFVDDGRLQQQTSGKRRKRTFEDYEAETGDVGEHEDYFANPEAVMTEIKRIKTIAQEQHIDPEQPTAETIRLMFDTGSILFCRGAPFETKLRERLTDPEWRDWEQKKFLFEGGHPIPPDLHPDVREKLETIKTEQVFAFIIHYQDMPPGVKLTFAKLNERFPQMLNKLIQGFDDTLDFGLVLTSMWYDLMALIN